MVGVSCHFWALCGLLADTTISDSQLNRALRDELSQVAIAFNRAKI